MDHLIDDSDRLKPCPFCGSDAEFGQIGSDQETPDAGGCFVQCLNSACGASSALIFPLMDDVKELLMERWNKRPNTRMMADEVPAIYSSIELATNPGMAGDEMVDAIKTTFNARVAA